MASHNAGQPDRREAFLLRQIQHLSAWQGQIVHHVLATGFVPAALTGRAVDWAQLILMAHDLAERQFAFSAARRHREPGMTKKSAGDSYCALYGHEYGIGIRADELAGVKANLARCFEHLSERTELLDVIRSGYGHAIELPLTFRLADTTITATPDLVFRTATGQLMIIDWKVAQSETSDYSRQLGVYAVAAVRCGRWIGVSPDTIALLEVNLLKNVVRQHAVNSEQFEDTEDFIYRSIVEQKALLGSGKFVDLKP